MPKFTVPGRRHLGVAALAAALTLYAAKSHALSYDGIQCAGHLVTVGETLQAVFAECGAPTVATHRHYKVRFSSGDFDTWTYRRFGSFDRVLLFQNQVLVSVEARGSQ